MTRAISVNMLLNILNMFYCAAPPAAFAMHQTKEAISQRMRNLEGIPDNTRDIDGWKLSSFEGKLLSL
jgi:hypothetical protein